MVEVVTTGALDVINEYPSFQTWLFCTTLIEAT